MKNCGFAALTFLKKEYLYWFSNVAGSESPPLFMATDKPERPPSKELRRIKSFMQGAKRPPMLSRRAASLMHNRSLDDLSVVDGKNQFCLLVFCLDLYETIEF